MELLEAMFAKKTANTKKSEDDEDEARKKKKGPLQILDATREKNVGIVLQFMRLPLETIERSVRRFEDLNLSEDNLEGLLSIIPQDDELGLLKPYAAPDAPPLAQPLSAPAQYFLMTMRVPRYAQRLRCWLSKRTFAKRHIEVDESIKAMLLGARSAVASQNFPRILQCILAIGNHLNAGTAFREARGFKMSDLPKLTTFRTTDAKSTMLEYLVDLVERKNPEFHSFSDELKPLLVMKSIDMASVQEELRKLRSEVTAAATLIKALRDDVESNIETFLGPFVHLANGKLQTTEAMLQETNDMIQQMAKFFGEDPKRVNLPELIGHIAEFVKSYATELKRQRDRDERKRRMVGGGPSVGGPAGSNGSPNAQRAGVASAGGMSPTPHATSSSGATVSPQRAEYQQHVTPSSTSPPPLNMMSTTNTVSSYDGAFEPIPSAVFPMPRSLRLSERNTGADGGHHRGVGGGRNQQFWDDVLGDD
ncbi:formin, putative [Bodo saltans]|uniref:Formin, putative n=1 Tax=Bodo saltans TaxID=75058 RepID=A0A0S4KPG2_BODSA|nr:formin, putative [Bodo saltans]|eukprot:CUI14803.1 formin, putative [Bodo saltans]